MVYIGWSTGVVPHLLYTQLCYTPRRRIQHDICRVVNWLSPHCKSFIDSTLLEADVQYYRSEKFRC